MPTPDQHIHTMTPYALRSCRLGGLPAKEQPGHMLLSAVAQATIIAAHEDNQLVPSLEERLNGRNIDPREVLTEGELALWPAIESAIGGFYDAIAVHKAKHLNFRNAVEAALDRGADF